MEKKETRERDRQLDIYRSISMIYILCVIHVVYWLWIGSEPLKSILLIEMPIIFFISGAAARLSYKDNRKFGDVLLSRFKRVLVPYYIYALVVFLIFLCLSILPIGYFEKFHHLQDYNISDIISILLSFKYSSYTFCRSYLVHHSLFYHIYINQVSGTHYDIYP